MDNYTPDPFSNNGQDNNSYNNNNNYYNNSNPDNNTYYNNGNYVGSDSSGYYQNNGYNQQNGYYQNNGYNQQNGYYQNNGYNQQNGYYQNNGYNQQNGYYQNNGYNQQNGYYQNNGYNQQNGYYQNNKQKCPSYAMFLALSIICLIFGNLVCGIIGIVLINTANTSYNRGDMQGYQSNLKGVKIALIIGLIWGSINILSSSLLGCASLMYM